MLFLPSINCSVCLFGRLLSSHIEVTSICTWRLSPMFSFLRNFTHCQLQNWLWHCVLYYESSGKALLTAAGDGYSNRKGNVPNVHSNKRRWLWLHRQVSGVLRPIPFPGPRQFPTQPVSGAVQCQQQQVLCQQYYVVKVFG